MKTRLLAAPLISAALLIALIFASSSLAATTFNRTCSVTGGSAQKVTSVLSTCGYSSTGGQAVTELTIRNPDAATYDLYVGQSDVDATNGYKLAPGDSKTWRSADASDPIPASGMYVFTSTTESKSFSVRAR